MKFKIIFVILGLMVGDNGWAKLSDRYYLPINPLAKTMESPPQAAEVEQKSAPAAASSRKYILIGGVLLAACIIWYFSGDSTRTQIVQQLKQESQQCVRFLVNVVLFELTREVRQQIMYVLRQIIR